MQYWIVSILNSNKNLKNQNQNFELQFEICKRYETEIVYQWEDKFEWNISFNYHGILFTTVGFCT